MAVYERVSDGVRVTVSGAEAERRFSGDARYRPATAEEAKPSRRRKPAEEPAEEPDDLLGED